MNEKIDSENSQTTFAKSGLFETRGNGKILTLYDGKRINILNGKISEFKFSKTDFNISKFSSTTTTHKKTQENSTKELIQCILVLLKFKKDNDNNVENVIINCTLKNLENIYEVLYSRIIKPLYVAFLIAISLLLILTPKSDPTFKFNKFRIYFFGFLSIIFLESSSKFISTNLTQNLLISFLPFFFLILIYFYFLIVLRVNKI